MSGINAKITLTALKHAIMQSKKDANEKLLVIPIGLNFLDFDQEKKTVVMKCIAFANGEDNDKYNEFSLKQSLPEEERNRLKENNEYSAFIGGASSFSDFNIAGIANISFDIELTALQCIIAPSKNKIGEYNLIIPISKNFLYHAVDKGNVYLDTTFWPLKADKQKFSITQSFPEAENKRRKAEKVPFMNLGSGKSYIERAADAQNNAVVSSSSDYDCDFGDIETSDISSGDEEMPF